MVAVPSEESRSRSRRSLRYLGASLAVLVLIFVIDELWRRGAGTPATAAAARLRNRDPSRRVAAVVALELFGQDEPNVALAALVASLSDEAPAVRVASALGLVRVIQAASFREETRPEAVRAVGSLRGLVKDPDPEVRAAALQALSLGTILWEKSLVPIDPALILGDMLEASVDPRDEVRLSAVRGMGTVGPKVAQDPPQKLFAALEEKSPKVRQAAAEALASFPGGLPRRLPDLVRSYEAARDEVRPAYASVFEKIRPPAFGRGAVLALCEALSSSDAEVRHYASAALASFGESSANYGYVEPPFAALPALVSAIGRPGRASRLVEAQHFALMPGMRFGWVERSGEQAESSVSAARAVLMILPGLPFEKPPPLDAEIQTGLSNGLRSEITEVRAMCATALGLFGAKPEALAVVGEAIDDPDPLVRASALRGVHDMADRIPFSPPKLLAATLEDDSPAVRYWGAGALGHIQEGVGPYVETLLRHAETDPDPDVRGVCLIEIEGFVRPTAVTPDVIPILMKRLDSDDPKIRSAVCGLLSRFGSGASAAIPRLLECFEETNDAERNATESAGRVARTTSVPFTLGKIAPKTDKAGLVAETMIAALKDDLPPRSMNEIVKALPEFGKAARSAIPILIELEMSSDANLRADASVARLKLEEDESSTP